MRDLRHEQVDVIAAERSRVATKGWGARLLELQASDGHHDAIVIADLRQRTRVDRSE